MKLFKLLLYFWCNVFGGIREMPQCVNASLFLVLWIFFGTNYDIFMAVICDMAKGRLADHKYFLESVHDLIKTDFVRNEVASSYIQIFIVRCILLMAPNKKEKIMSCMLSMVSSDCVSWYCVCSQQKLKIFNFILGRWPHITMFF